MEEGRSAFKVLTGKPIEKRPLGRLWSRRTILDWILKKTVSKRRIGFIRLRIGIIGEYL
jgi:hypothetical protein